MRLLVLVVVVVAVVGAKNIYICCNNIARGLGSLDVG